jgi:YVTN family beta-propeller protein
MNRARGFQRFFGFALVGFVTAILLLSIVPLVRAESPGPETFTVTFSETGLPARAEWSVGFNGTLMNASAGTSIVFSVPNGIYYYFTHAHGHYHLLGVPGEGTLAVDGSDVVVSSPFVPGPVYSVEFRERGLESGTIWCAAVVVLGCAAAPHVLVWSDLSPGTYGYAVSPQGLATTSVTLGGVPVNASGTVTVPRSAVFLVEFGYFATFAEAGLPIGTSWSVTVGGQTQRSEGPTITFDLMDGTYGYSVRGATGYMPSLGSGRFTVNRYALTISVLFVQVNPSHPYGVAYDSAKAEVFVTNSALNDVSVISDATDKIVATVAVGSFPIGVVVDSTSGEVFVTNFGSGSVSVISDSSNTIVATIKVGVAPYFDAYDSGLNEIFVPNDGTSNVSVISGATNSVVATVTVGDGPDVAAYDPGTNEVFVSNIGSDSVSVISDMNNSVVATVAVGSGPFGVAYDPTDRAVYVANTGSDNVSIISELTYTVEDTVNVGNYPVGVGYDSGTHVVYVSNLISDSVTSIFPPTYDTNQTGVGQDPIGLAYDSGLSEEFVADEGSNEVQILSEVLGTVIATIET